MKITIEPTRQNVNDGLPANCMHTKVSIEHPYDDIGLYDFMQVVRAAVIATGYPEKLVNEYIPEP